MADRRSGQDDDGRAKRKRKEPEPQKQAQEPEKESALPEQEAYGNSFMVDAMRINNDRAADGIPGGGPETQQQTGQGYGGIDDGGGPPRRPQAANHWFRPRFRNKSNDEIESLDGEPDEPGIPDEDEDWLAELQPQGEAWDDPAPQPHPHTLEGGLPRWLFALFPLAGAREAQFAVAKALIGDPELQDRTGAPLLGVAAAAAIGSAVSHRAGSTTNGRSRLARGLAIASAPEAPRDPGRTALQLSMIEGEPAELTPAPEDRWLARLVSLRLGLDRPPIPELSDPPPAQPPSPDDPVNLDEVFQRELGDPPDPIQALRASALDGCEAQARWAVQLRAASAGIARALVDQGVDASGVITVLSHMDAEVTKATGLLQEIAGAARGGAVPIRGLRNGLSRGARVLTGAHRIALTGLTTSAALGGAFGLLPEPTFEDLGVPLRDGRPLPPQDVPRLPVHQTFVDALEALAEGDTDTAHTAGVDLVQRAAARQDGIGYAAGTLLQMRAHEQRGDVDTARTLRNNAGARLLGAGSRGGLSLLARWEAA